MDSQPFDDLIKDWTPFHWTHEHEKHFQSIKDRISEGQKKKLEKLLKQLEDADNIREMGEGDEMGSLFVNPILLMLKKHYVKLVIDARYLNLVTDLTN